MTKIGAAGVYIFNLVGYDYDDVDFDTINLVVQLIVKHGVYKICTMADTYVEEFPEIDIHKLLEKIEENADSFDMPALEEKHEIDY